MSLPKKNDIIELEITTISSQGSGIGRYNGVVVFVPTSVPGDILNVKVVKVLKNRMYGIVHSIIKPGKGRVEIDCPVFPECGGCTLRHMDYSVELEQKAGFLQDNLQRIGKVSPEIEQIIPSPLVDRYRNKAQYPVRTTESGVQVGFYASRSHRLIAMQDCLLQPESFSKISEILCSHMEKYNISTYDEKEHKGLVRHLALRSSQDEKEIMVTLVINGKELPEWQQLLESLKENIDGIKTLTLNHNTKKTNVIMGKQETLLYGDGVIEDTLSGVKLELSPISFYQVNHGATELLYSKVLEYAKPLETELVLDLYCGIGSIGLSLAKHVKKVIGVEIVPDAVENAKKNAQKNNIENAEFIHADAAKAAEKLAQQGINPDIVIIDPPRKGVDKKTIDAVVSMAPSRVVYVSCNTATLARDVKIFAEQGYESKRAVAVDLFPRTAHVESVVLLEKVF